MVGVADVPCIGKFVDKVSDYTVEAVFRGLKYMFCYKSLVDQLNSETDKLNIQMDNMSREVEKEKDNGKIIKTHVLKWQDDATELKKNGKEYSPSCSCIQSLPIPNPVSRFQIGRNAANKAATVIELVDTGNKYLAGDIAYLAPVINMPKSDTTFEEFQSRKDTYRKLYDALVNQDSPMVHGIYGMAGVGKTRMMEKFWEDVMEKKIFDKVVRINVGNENTDEIKLQDQIAGRLNCHLDSQDVVEDRASQLEQSLRNGGKILLIFDDVWTAIPLDNIIGTPFTGTPFTDDSNSKGSKILFTSRELDVLKRNKCEHLVEIKILSPDEALNLFKKAVGADTINSLQDKSLVQKVCDECGDLPLIIQVVGEALKDEDQDLWVDAHDQLRKGKFEKIDGIDEQVYKCIKLSIDKLKQRDAKSCLFLCSFFPEDANIDTECNMEMLIQLATGSQLIPEGRSRILAMVQSLKKSSLLLDSRTFYHNETKVHDIIRDVARSVAISDSNYAFLQVTCNSKFLPSNADYSNRKFLRLDVETDDVQFHENVVCPDVLRTLWLQSNDHPQQFLGGFFIMFANLSFLMLQEVNISLEKFSLQSLDNLRTLSLIKCDISKTDVTLFPKKLESLWIYEGKLPRPLDVANLEYLQKLEIQQEEKFAMRSSVRSSLACLKELNISNGIMTPPEDYHSVVMEISKLTDLRSLQFHFDDDDTFQGRNVFSNLDRYNISVGESWRSIKFRIYHKLTVGVKVLLLPRVGRCIELYGNHWQPWEGLMARAEEVRLVRSSIEVSSICKGRVKAFEDLTGLSIEECGMGYLASISHDEIHNEATCFSKLTILEIRSCSKLKYLFCNNIAKGLVQLQHLSVRNCNSMEAIIMNDGTSDREIIEFPKLRLMEIVRAERLASFYHAAGSTSAMDSSSQHQLFLDQMTFPSLEKLMIWQLPNTSVIWGIDCFNSDTLSSFSKLSQNGNCDKMEIVIPEAMSHRLNNLEYINVYDCKSLRAMFPLSVATALKHLNKLEVQDCEKMTDIIEAGEQVIYCQDLLILLQLESIVLKGLPGLKRLFHGANFEFHFPALKEVEVKNCGLSTLFTFSMFSSFQLKNLQVQNCELLENIVEDVRGDETCNKTITLSQLIAVTLSGLPNLKSSFHNANYEFHMPVIEKVKVHHCGLSNTLFTRSIFKNLKQLETLEVSDCELLEGIFEDARGDETLNTSDKIITLNQISTVFLDGLPKFKSIFCGATFECYMPALKKVKIVGCGLSVLFTCSVFEKIQQLEELHVSNCDSLEHIVGEVGGGETSEVNGKSITYSKLSSITLESLPNLKSFSCNSSYVFNMPNLEKFRLIKCPQIEYFSSSETNTSFECVSSDYCSGQYVFQKSKLLESKLTILYIQSCSKLKYLFCNNIAKGLVQLQDLSVRNCNSMEAIIMNDGTSDREIIEFPKLRNMEIVRAERLASFYHAAGSTSAMDSSSQHQPLFDQMVVFPSLQELTILGLSNTSVIWGKDCFHSDTLSSFSKLNGLDVSSCDKLEIVIPEAMLHRLNNLEYIKVYDCKSLRAMFPLSVATALKHLRRLRVWDCEKMTDIIEAGFYTPSTQVNCS
ncbi:disease resistance protein At4g27190-like isoform X2 [Apium graveolens]|uniref:disease resistance protein At4g27190-like isoform X2 n=1 Tax=Apium graveolens TaxID=4045 RepID=UPI003D7B6F5C